MDLTEVTVEKFTPHLNRTFRIAALTNALEAELIEASSFGEAPKGGRARFTLVFRGPVGAILPQGIYRVSSEGMEEMEIFLVTNGVDEAGTLYSASFC